ncbi:MAG: hypothetical protein BGO67_04310 [Alphaproteobacteria bacterium 41-28]|nr:MAG: hypothetical protein BGO67_04310 [Alphaproteobacteria bacterium 41-28]
MTAEELAERHPRLYHVTEPGAWESIRQKGLLSTTSMLDLFEIKDPSRATIEGKRRSSAVLLEHPNHGRVIINDNVPLNEKALEKCLNENLTPADWLRILNARVFFWANEEGLNRLLGARHNRNRSREVIVVDTLSLAKAHAERIELCPINSGSTLRKPARRGLDTFTPMLQYSYNDWRKLRGRRDQILEIVVRDHVLDIGQHMVEVLRIKNG